MVTCKNTGMTPSCKLNFCFLFKDHLLHTQVFAELGDTSLLPCHPLLHWFLCLCREYKNCAFPTVTYKLCKIRVGRRAFSALIWRRHWILNKGLLFPQLSQQTETKMMKSFKQWLNSCFKCSVAATCPVIIILHSSPPQENPTAKEEMRCGI